LLRWRRDDAMIMAYEAYQPVEIDGERGGQLFAFERRGATGRVLVVASRLTLVADGGPPVGDYWAGCSLPVGGAGEGSWRNVLTDETVRAEGGSIRLPSLLRVLPVAVLVERA
jgi:maltooligosyltrehalose synthase